jgi:hypothetical protein
MNNTHTQDESLEVREMMLVAPQNQKRENHQRSLKPITGGANEEKLLAEV